MIKRIVELIDAEVLAAASATVLAREVNTDDGKIWGIMIAHQHLQAAMDMIAALPLIVATKRRSERSVGGSK